MQNELNKLTKNQLVELVAHFEHYPAVTEENDRDYILAYLEDESCTIKEDEILEYMFKMGVEITEENLPLYHKFMSDEDLIYNRKIVDSVLAKRLKMLADILNIKNNKELQVFGVEGLNGSDTARIHSLDVVFNNYLLKTVIYEVEDSLKPIYDYLEEIRESEKYKISTSECRCNNCMTYFESDDDLEDMEDENGSLKGCPKCKTDSYLMNLSDNK